MAMRKFRRFAPLLSAAAAIFCALSFSSNATQADNSEKTLEFPKAYSVGSIIDVAKDPGLECNIHGNRLCKAQGIVKVPRAKHLKFEPDGHFFEHPECLSKLPIDAFDYIELRFSSVADNEENMSDKVIPYVAHLKGLKAVSLDKTDTTDVGAAKLAALPNLNSLSCTASLVTGQCLADLRRCKSVKFLRFGGVQIDHNSLQYLKQFPNLERLAVSRVGLNKADLEQICKCSGLVNLAISQNQAIDDTCLPLLSKLKKLTDLELAGTSISTGALEKCRFLKNVNLSLPKPLSTYSPQQQARFKQLFPRARFNLDSLNNKKTKRELDYFLDISK